MIEELGLLEIVMGCEEGSGSPLLRRFSSDILHAIFAKSAQQCKYYPNAIIIIQ